MEGDDSGGACRIIALNKTLRAECERMLPVLDAAKAPATEAQALEIIARRMVAYGVTANAAFAHGVTWESYLAALETFPPAAIEDAFDRWDRGEGVKDIAYAGIAPRPPQLALLAHKGKADIWTAAYRAHKALDHVEKTGVEWTAARKAEERQKMIDQGLLTPDGKPNFELTARGMPETRPHISQHEMAEQLRRSAGQARALGQPISRRDFEDDPGDVV